MWLTPEWMGPKFGSLLAKEVTAEPAALVPTGALPAHVPEGHVSEHKPRVLAAVTGKNVPWEH